MCTGLELSAPTLTKQLRCLNFDQPLSANGMVSFEYKQHYSWATANCCIVSNLSLVLGRNFRRSKLVRTMSCEKWVESLFHWRCIFCVSLKYLLFVQVCGCQVSSLCFCVTKNSMGRWSGDRVICVLYSSQCDVIPIRCGSRKYKGSPRLRACRPTPMPYSLIWGWGISPEGNN